MSTAPIIDESMPYTWQGQLRALVDQYKTIATRADADREFARMARVVGLYVENHPADDGGHANIKDSLRKFLRAHLDGDRYAFGKLLHIARLADMQEEGEAAKAKTKKDD